MNNLSDTEIIKALDILEKWYFLLGGDDIENSSSDIAFIRNIINRLKAENERLKEDIKAQDSSISSLMNIVNSNYQLGRIEAVKEFAERLKEEVDFVDTTRKLKQTINNLLKELVDRQPTADVAEVKHGEWIQTTEPLGWQDVDCIECSACHGSWIMGDDVSLEDYIEGWKYCSNCGAKMDGGKSG